MSEIYKSERLFENKNRSRVAWLFGFLSAGLLFITVMNNPKPVSIESPIKQPQISDDKPSTFRPLPTETVENKVILPRFNPYQKIQKVFDTTLKMHRGQNLSSLLKSYGLEASEVETLVSALSKKVALKSLKVGTEFHLQIAENNDYDVTEADTFHHHLKSISFTSGPGEVVTAQKDNQGVYKLKTIYSKITMQPVIKSGKIVGSLYKSAQNAGIPAGMISQSIKKFSYNVDFRALRKGDEFEYSFNEYYDDSGKRVGTGHLLFASLKVKGKKHEIYYITDKDGKGEWYNEKGASNKALLMRTPIDGARISSNYGMRRHPVLGYSKMHRGVDFAAPTGTPIYAAGDGVVTKKYRSRTYGNYIRLRHTGQYSTAYAHLSRFRRGIGVGSSVKQGQVIGYVGNTGRSTGPHLHYEVLKNGKQINPHSKNLPVQKPVSNAKKKLYKKLKAEITRRRSGEMETKTYSSIKDLKGDII